MMRVVALASVSALHLVPVDTPVNLGLWAILGLPWSDSQLGQEIVRLVLLIDFIALACVCLQLARRWLVRSKAPTCAASLCVTAWQIVETSSPDSPGLWAMWAVVLGLPLHDSHLGR